FVANETEKIDKYVRGLLDNIYESVKASKPKTLDETIKLANDLMDQKLCTCAERQTNNKRKADDSFRNNHGHQQQPLKIQNVAKVYNMGTGEKKPYSGNFPKNKGAQFAHSFGYPRANCGFRLRWWTFAEGLGHSLNGLWSHVVWVSVVRRDIQSLCCYRCHDSSKSQEVKREIKIVTR
nr:hypothetical protein [Tanacetum cinerariifolium]